MLTFVCIESENYYTFKIIEKNGGKEMEECVVRTEYGTIYTEDVIINGSYVWVEELKTLYRILDEDETEIQVAVIITINKTEIKACRVMTCRSAEEAFSLMKYNIERAKESLVSLMLQSGEETEEIERIKEEFDKLM